MHYEQRWLDLVPAFFEGTHVLRDPAFNVAHWNLPERSIEIHEGAVLVDGRPCRLFRFSGYDPDVPHAPTRYSTRLTWENLGPARDLFERYRRALEEDGYQQTKQWPYAYSTFDNGVAIPDFVRHLYRQSGNGRRTVRRSTPNRDAAADCHRSNRRVGLADVRSTVRRLTPTISGSTSRSKGQPGPSPDSGTPYISSRTDLQDAFPDVFGADRSRFVAWTASSGMREHGLPDEFLNPSPRMTPFEMSGPRVAIATVVARNYLSFARVLALSLRAHHPHVRFLVVVAADPDTDWQLEGEPFEIVALDNLGIPNLRRICFRSSRLELAVTVKPFLMRHLLDRGVDGAIFLDPDVLVVGDLTPLFVEVTQHAIVLTPHLLQPLEGDARIARELNILQSGTFNAGFVGASDAPATRSRPGMVAGSAPRRLFRRRSSEVCTTISDGSISSPSCSTTSA